MAVVAIVVEGGGPRVEEEGEVEVVDESLSSSLAVRARSTLSIPWRNVLGTRTSDDVMGMGLWTDSGPTIMMFCTTMAMAEEGDEGEEGGGGGGEEMARDGGLRMTFGGRWTGLNEGRTRWKGACGGTLVLELLYSASVNTLRNCCPPSAQPDILVFRPCTRCSTWHFRL